MNIGIVVILFLLALSFLGVPIYLSLGVGTTVALLMADIDLLVLPQKLFYGMNSSSLLAIPFFILAGSIMAHGLTEKLIAVANAIIGHIRGSLALVTILSSGLFGAISGSGVATASAIGGITIPAMKKEGYPDHFAAAIASISSILGPIIPPSIVLIVYASITNVSVSGLFLGSLLPGIILIAILMIYVLRYGKKHELPAHERQTAKEAGKTAAHSIWALLMPVIILGGIFAGIFTPTEAAVVACVYAILVGVFVYKDLKWKDLPRLFVDASVSTAAIMVMVGISKASSYVIVVSYLPQMLTELFQSMTSSTVVIYLMLNILFLIIGMLMEANAAVIMMVPIITPLFSAFGIDSLQFGVVMAFNLCIGLVTPPVGLCLLISNQIADASIGKTLRSMMPSLGIAVAVLFLITYVPQIVTWLPSFLS